MANVKQIEIGVGLSIDKNGTWVKTDARVTVDVEKGDTLHDCFERAFEIADNEVTAQLKHYGISEDN